MKKLQILITLFLFAFASTIAQNKEVSKALQKTDQHFFIENKGQWPSEVLYLTQSAGVNTWITRKGMWFEFFKTEEIKITDKPMTNEFAMPEKFEHKETKRWGHRVGYTLVGNNQNVQTEPNGKQECYYNYLLGNDPSKHASYVGLYEEVKVNEVYQGIGMRYYFEKGNLRYDFIVEPGADPNQIQFRFEGSEKSYLNANGELVFTTFFGEVKNADLFCYQLLNNGTSLKSVTAKFDRRQENWVINLGDYDKEQTLIIDPLIYSTYIGGNSIDEGRSIVLDTFKNAYITGTTHSPNYDVTAGAFQTLFAGNSDVFVSKLNANGSALIYSTYIGGGDPDYGSDIAIDLSGEVYITGSTRSLNYPITAGAFQSINAGNGDIFVTKLSSTGSSLIYSTFLGGASTDAGQEIVLDTLGNAYVTGYAGSLDFDITPGAFQINNSGSGDAFVTKLNSMGTGLIYSTFIGGTNNEWASSIDIDVAGNIYITGETESTNYPTTIGAFQTSLGGFKDVFVTKLNPTGTTVIYSTFIGGLNSDYGYGIVVDSVGSAFVSGRTFSSDFDVTVGAYQTVLLGGGDAFVTKLNATGTTLLYSTYVGGSLHEDASYDIEIDSFGNAIITGETASADYYVTPGAFQISNAGGYDGFVSKLNASGTAMIYSTFIGGLSNDVCFSATLDNSNYLYVTGWTHASNFPIIAGAFQSFYSGNVDVFISKMDLIPCLGAITATSNSPVCDGEILNLSVNGIVGATYNWTGPNGFTSALQNPSMANVTMAAAGVYTITIIDANGCSNSSTTNSIINPLPTVIANSDTTLCEGQTLDLTVTPTAGATYSWSGPNGFTSALQNPSIANVTMAANGDYTVDVVDSNGCSKSDTTNVKILVCTGIAESMQDNTILIFPNPNNGTFTLQASKLGNYELLDVAGRIINTYEVKNSPYIIAEKLSSGMYFIREKDSGASIRSRVAQKVMIE